MSISTTRPRLKLGSHLVPGLAAVALFVVMAAAFVGAQFPQPQGFPADASITANIGYAMFNLDLGGIPAEGFLVVFVVIAVVLDVAIDAAVYLATREEGGLVELATERGGTVREVRDSDEAGGDR